MLGAPQGRAIPGQLRPGQPSSRQPASRPQATPLSRLASHLVGIHQQLGGIGRVRGEAIPSQRELFAQPPRLLIGRGILRKLQDNRGWAEDGGARMGQRHRRGQRFVAEAAAPLANRCTGAHTRQSQARWDAVPAAWPCIRQAIPNSTKGAGRAHHARAHQTHANARHCPQGRPRTARGRAAPWSGRCPAARTSRTPREAGPGSRRGRACGPSCRARWRAQRTRRGPR